MSLPRNSTWPWLGSSCPVSILKKVIFPATFGPTRQRSSPSASVKLTLRTALTPPKCMLRSRVCRRGVAIALLRLLRLEAALLLPLLAAEGSERDFGQCWHQSLGDQQHECDQDATQDQRRVGEDLRPKIRAAARLVGAERGAQPLDADATNDRADQRAASADNDPDDDLRGLRQAKDGRADEVAPVREQAAGKAGQRAADGEGRKLVGAWVIAEQLGAPLILPDADDDAAEL